MQNRWNNVNRDKLLPKNGNNFQCAIGSERADSGNRKSPRPPGSTEMGQNVGSRAKMLENMLLHQIQ